MLSWQSGHDPGTFSCLHLLSLLWTRTCSKRVSACFLVAALQTKEFEIGKQSPCGHGHVICFSIYGGAEVNFRRLISEESPLASASADGSDPPAVQSQLWVDTMLDDEVGQLFVVVNCQYCHCCIAPTWLLLSQPMSTRPSPPRSPLRPPK